MMDKQKQIEEMAKIICKDGANNGDCDKCGFHRQCSKFKVAEKLYNAGCRKIPENAVVIPKEEYDELQKGIKTYNYTAMFDAQDAYSWEQGYLQGTKETAEEFIKDLDYFIGHMKPSEYSLMGAILAINDEAYKIANKFGVYYEDET